MNRLLEIRVDFFLEFRQPFKKVNVLKIGFIFLQSLTWKLILSVTAED